MKKSTLSDTIENKERLKLKTKRKEMRSVWAGLGLFGMIGWSVVIPTVVGVLSGIWLDQHLPVRFSWTLSLLVGGLTLGCINAWYWVDKEHQSIKKEQEDESQ